ncbi:hypothetical protein [Wielerella bovis]|uniref:hypothetical protein n=1 Tax=Wielerella bovis TaxID=2917790 RepID=UPI002018B983|nr:hypothetical protein [Wielerella bovis]ULJ61593.1 hypothetical protein MIS46_06150 [Wielerella bovis]ULJ63709.1 hypothetical protein MIS33_05890 [Wielerella bovis]ULJ66114.1 hypothetical protein MIS31_07495 [Wielerella bovis]
MNYNNWQQILDISKPLVNFLNSNNFLHHAYNGVTDKFIITSDVYFCMHMMEEHYDEWEDIKNLEFHEHFKWYDIISKNLYSTNYLGALNKDFGNAMNYFAKREGTDFKDIMGYDIGVLFNCYANDYFPNIWKDILYIYLHNGFPCGWRGNYPDGKIIVYSCDT